MTPQNKWKCKDRNTMRLLIAVLSILPLVAFLSQCSPPAHALSVSSQVNVVLGWSGADCVNMWEPDLAHGARTVLKTYSCEPSKSIGGTFSAYRGQWIGVDPIEAAGVTLSCTVVSGGKVVMESTGPVASCLGRW